MSIGFSNLPLAAAAAVIAILAVALVVRSSLPRIAGLCLGGAAVLLALAAAGPHARWQRGADVLVVLDVSASTRSAAYRDRTHLEIRINQLLPGIEPRIVEFSGDDARRDDVTRPAELSDLLPPSTDAVVLFSDGNFNVPNAAPPTFAVIDPGIAAAVDAAVKNLMLRQNEVVATISNNGSRRELNWSPEGKTDQIEADIPVLVLSAPIGDEVTSISARLNAGDLWPENDFASIRRPVVERQRWWIGESAPPGWRQLAPSQLPSDVGDYLSAGVIVVDAAAGAFSADGIELLAQFVRDLGGLLIQRGGPDGFAAGDWTATPLDALSPLAATPPEPSHDWLVLIDASGSMSAPAGGSSRFRQAVEAMRGLVARLPPDDLAAVGSFSERVQLWSGPLPARELAGAVAAPADLTPRGPTNLAPILEELAAGSGARSHVIVMVTDGEAVIADPEALAGRLRNANARLFVLAIGARREVSAIDRVAELSGGRCIQQTSPDDWDKALRDLAQSALDPSLLDLKRDIDLAPPLSQMVRVEAFNQTYARERANVLARSQNNVWPLAAEWRAGAGRVVAIAFEATPQLVESAARVFAGAPRDPRFHIQFIDGRIRVDAIGAGSFMNGLEIRARPTDQSGGTLNLGQVAPGRYEATVSRSPSERVFEILIDDRVADRIAIPAQAAEEFDRIGLNRTNLTDLAERSGGAVIEPEQQEPLPIPAHWRRKDLTGACAAAAAVLTLCGLIAARYARRSVI